MNSFRPTAVLDRPPLSERALERMALEALRCHEGVLPKRPGVVPIERLIEVSFGFNERYEQLEDGILGEIRFGIEDRPLGIRIARSLGEINFDNPAIDHERRNTLAHECGHGLAHSKLFARGLRRERAPRLPGFDDGQRHIACRDHDISNGIPRPGDTSPDELWLEWEANYLMGALLLPRHLILQHVDPWLSGSPNGIAPRILPLLQREHAVMATSKKFNVSYELADRRLDQLLPETLHPDLFQSVGMTIPLSREKCRPQATQSDQREAKP